MTKNKLIGEVELIPLDWKDKVLRLLRITPKQIALTISEYSADKTRVISEIISQIKAVESDDMADALNSVSDNIPIYAHLIATAVETQSEREKQQIKRSIMRHWTSGQLAVAATIVYENIDFESIIGALYSLGRIRSYIPGGASPEEN